MTTAAQRRRAEKKARRAADQPRREAERAARAAARAHVLEEAARVWPDWAPELPPLTRCDGCGHVAAIALEPNAPLTPCLLCGSETATLA